MWTASTAQRYIHFFILCSAVLIVASKWILARVEKAAAASASLVAIPWEGGIESKKGHLQGHCTVRELELNAAKVVVYD